MAKYIVAVRKKPLSTQFWICPRCCQLNIILEKKIKRVACVYCQSKFEAFRAEDWGES